MAFLTALGILLLTCYVGLTALGLYGVHMGAELIEKAIKKPVEEGGVGPAGWMIVVLLVLFVMWFHGLHALGPKGIQRAILRSAESWLDSSELTKREKSLARIAIKKYRSEHGIR
jgi:cellobiose-specific phosphotransferase system component IIC